MKQAGIIESHFHLHKRQNLEAIRFSFKRQRAKLERDFISFSDKFLKHSQPLNMVKNYLGEKHAFEFAYLMHYNAWLGIASILGALLIIIQIVVSSNIGWKYFENDTAYNAIYGFFICIWAVCFIESWKVKES